MTTNYSIRTLENNTIMVKTKEQFKDWVKKYNAESKDGGRVDLRNAKGGMVIRVNGKLLRVATTIARPEDFYRA